MVISPVFEFTTSLFSERLLDIQAAYNARSNHFSAPIKEALEKFLFFRRKV
tara:strand:- start:1880 stop:2032 length:153 start_codon:yes stop_codon:yes gene_type:complete